MVDQFGKWKVCEYFAKTQNHYNYIALQFYLNEFSYHDLIISWYGLLTAEALLFWGEAYILQWNNVGRDETINFSSRVRFRMRVVLILLDAKTLLLGIRGSLPISRGWNETAYIFAKVSFMVYSRNVDRFVETFS